MNVQWQIRPEILEAVIRGEINLSKVGPLGIAIRVDRLNPVTADVYVDIEDSKRVYGTYGPITLGTFETFHITDIAQAFTITVT